jgi:hypothetical protein
VFPNRLPRGSRRGIKQSLCCARWRRRSLFATLPTRLGGPDQTEAGAQAPREGAWDRHMGRLLDKLQTTLAIAELPD